jgi:hypothetical protein
VSNRGYLVRQVNYFLGKNGHLFALVFEHEVIDVTDRAQCLDLVKRADLVGLASKGPATQWGGIVPLPGDVEGASYVVNAPSKADAADALRARARELQAEVDRENADPAYALEKLLKAHDWYAHNSDDDRVYRASEAHWRKIEALRAKVTSETYDALLAKYAPRAEVK